LHKARVSKFDRILDRAPAMFNAAQLRVFLRALVTIDPYAFDDVAEHLAANDDNNEQSSEEILLSTIDGLPDDKLTGFALRLVLTGHTPIPRESEIDFLSEAEAAFVPLQPKRTASKKAKASTPIKAAHKTAAKKTTAKKQAAA
jgi:ParB family chromosome partitioning protein